MKHERTGMSEPAAATKEQTYTVITAILAALLIAASNVGQPNTVSLLGGYAYWVVRIAIESALFILVRDAIENGGREHIAAVIDAVESTEAIAYTARAARAEADLALQALGDVPPSPYREALQALAEFAVSRSY